MKKILFIFANSAITKGLADAVELQRIMQEAIAQHGDDAEINVTYSRSLSYFVSNKRSVVYDHKNRMALEEYDFVYFRRAGANMQQMLACAIYLTQHGVPFFDQEIFASTSRNKLSQMFKLQASSVSIPATLFCRHKTRLLRLLRTKFKNELPFPVIAKATAGTRGDANYLVHTPEELAALLAGSRRQFLIQQFIPNDGDYRVLVMNGGNRGIIHRTAVSGSHLNNTSQGGAAAWLPPETLSQQAAHDAIQAAVVLLRNVAGVDVILDKNTGEHYILEVNRAPQIEHASYPEQKAAALWDAIKKAMDHHTPYAEAIHSKGRDKRIIGRFEKVMLPDGRIIIAKVDTGADSSSLHCERIEETIGKDGKQMLRYSFAAKGDSWQETEQFSKVAVRSSSGHRSERYALPMAVTIGGQVYNGVVTLSKRHDMSYEMLLGRRFLRDNALAVDVARRFVLSRQKVEG